MVLTLSKEKRFKSLKKLVFLDEEIVLDGWNDFGSRSQYAAGKNGLSCVS